MLQASLAAAKGASSGSRRSSSGSQEGGEQEGMVPELPEPLHTRARQMWLASAVDVHVSRLQQSVSSALSAAGEAGL